MYQFLLWRGTIHSPTYLIFPPTPLPSMLRSTALLLVLFIGRATVADQAPAVSFEKDIRPILKAACFHCHGEEGVKEGGLDVRLSRFLLEGGDSGPAFVKGNGEESYLYQRVRDGEMPPEESHQLSPEEIETIRKWIDAGAPTLREEPETLEGPLITPEELAHWSYQPIQAPEIPKVQGSELVSNPIDAFILQQLEAEGFSFTTPAERNTLIRRLKFNLTGLPPTPEEIEKFVKNESPDAYSQLVDHWLASPHYGERWGRHWLDVAGYSDSEGYNTADKVRPDAWRYRDYVIRSFNEDKPFDRFILEQLAGDELITSKINNLTPEDAELLAATGFLRMAPDGTGGAVDDKDLARNEVVAETLKIVTSSLMGMTVGCAQCHDHRYDPIPQADYYQLRAVFDPALDWKKWRTPAQRRVSLYTDEDRKLAAEIEEEAKKILAERAKKQDEFIQATFEKQLAKLPEELHELGRAAHATAAKKRTPEQKDLIKKHPTLNVTAGSLYLYDRKAADELKALADKANEIRKKKPQQNYVRATMELNGVVPDSYLFARGDHEQPKQKVLPSGLTVVSLTSDVPEIPENDPKFSTTGRRTALAKRLTHPNHPLTARVIVNRIWLHHFGQGLVATPTDFGKLGAKPTHPELLDWLALEFINSGWSVKHLHRLILNSTTWQQAAHRSQDLAATDPENLLYGAANLRRIDAETVRDSILFVAGVLNEDVYGEPVPVMADKVGRWVLGIENLNAGRPGKVIPLRGEEHRRSVYVQSRRSRPLSVMEAFDLPQMSPNCEVRRASTATPQSLMLLNSEFALNYSKVLAERIQKEHPDNLESQIQAAWNLSYGRNAESSEVVEAQAFVGEQVKLLEGRISLKKDDDAQPIQLEALANLCQMLFSSNEFLYIN